MKLAAPRRQLCTSQLLFYHKSTHSRGCHICFSHSHILYEHLYAKDDPLEMSLHDSVISGFCGTGLEVHVCWQTSGGLQNQEFWELQKEVSLPNSKENLLLWCRHPARAAIPHFHPSLFAESNPVSRRLSSTHICILCTH